MMQAHSCCLLRTQPCALHSENLRGLWHTCDRHASTQLPSFSRQVVSNSWQPCGLQLTRLP